MSFIEVLSNQISSIESQINAVTNQIQSQGGILQNLESPRTGLKIEVVNQRAAQAQRLRSELPVLNNTLVRLREELGQLTIQQQEQIPIISMVEIQQTPQTTDNTLRNALIIGGIVLLLI